MLVKNWPYGAMTTTTSGRIPRSATKPRSERAGRLNNLSAPHPARLPNPKPTTINKPDSRYDRGTTGGQVTVPLSQLQSTRRYIGGKLCKYDDCIPSEKGELPQACHAKPYLKGFSQRFTRDGIRRVTSRRKKRTLSSPSARFTATFSNSGQSDSI